MYSQTSPRGDKVRSSPSSLSVLLSGPAHSYLHINGLMHRDIKAANLLIDDDGTVLLGDLGVATFLCDPEDQRPHSTEPDQRRVVSFDQPSKQYPTLSHAYSLPRPRLGKRKSFVGTVGSDLIAPLSATLIPITSAMLDGPGGYTGSQVRRQSRHLVFRHHCARAGSGSTAPLARIAPQRTFEDVSLLATPY